MSGVAVSDLLCEPEVDRQGNQVLLGADVRAVFDAPTTTLRERNNSSAR